MSPRILPDEIEESHGHMSNEERLRDERETTLALLQLLNDHGDTHGLIRKLADLLRKWTGCTAVGVRLREGDDYPYYEVSGSPESFSQAEPGLCKAETDDASTELLPCLCANVLRGSQNPLLPFLTARGAFWTNDYAALRGRLSEEQKRFWVCERCMMRGVRSAAYIPLRHNGDTFGLLQLNDPTPGRFTPDLLEFLEGIASQIASTLAQREEEAARVESERELHRLAEALAQTGDGVIITSVNDIIEYVNPAFEKMTGFSSEGALGRSSFELCGVSLAGQSAKDLALSREQNRPWTGRMICRRRNGTRYTEQATISPIVAENGQVEHFVTIKRDITREIEREKRLRDVRRRESIERLAAGVAHNQNNALTPILGYSTMLLAMLEPKETQYAQVQEIRKAAERSRDLVRRLLAFSRSQALALELQDLPTIARSLERTVRRMLRPDIELVMDLEDGCPPVRVDRRLIEHVIVVLVDNGLDAMAQRGVLRIVSRGALPAEVEALRQMGIVIPTPVILKVCDSGPGMSDEIRQHLFEPFYSTKGTERAGLGLSSVWGIVQQHGGTVTVEDAPDGGTWVTIVLPGLPRRA